MLLGKFNELVHIRFYFVNSAVHGWYCVALTLQTDALSPYRAKLICCDSCRAADVLPLQIASEYENFVLIQCGNCFGRVARARNAFVNSCRLHSYDDLIFFGRSKLHLFFLIQKFLVFCFRFFAHEFHGYVIFFILTLFRSKRLQVGEAYKSQFKFFVNNIKKRIFFLTLHSKQTDTKMIFSKYSETNFVATTSTFGGKDPNGELHAIVSTCNPDLTFAEQTEAVAEGVRFVMKKNALYTPVFVRLLLSDAANQAAMATARIKKDVGEAAVAYIEQPPLHGAKIVAFMYLRQNVDVERVDEFTVKVAANGYTHFYTANCVFETEGTYRETALQLEYLEKTLRAHNLNIADHCVRTWFFVQNIDVNYAEVVRARRDNFDQNGLTIDTHYISSTGICGRNADKKITSVMDAYCVGGLHPGQMKYLYAAQNLNRTSDYGVTFERGTTVDYSDRRHVIISGTASIDNHGQIVAVGDIKAQTFRMIENVRALLSEGGAAFSDIAHIICYLRDVADYQVVSKIFATTFPEIPLAITLAPVCRPGWLIEMECMAIVGK